MTEHNTVDQRAAGRIDPLSREYFIPRVPWQRFQTAANRIRFNRLKRTEDAQWRRERAGQIEAMQTNLLDTRDRAEKLRRQLREKGLVPVA